jgi:hypothetical protein
MIQNNGNGSQPEPFIPELGRKIQIGARAISNSSFGAYSLFVTPPWFNIFANSDASIFNSST